MMKHCKDSGFPVVTSDSIRDFSVSVVSGEYRDGLVMRCDDEVARYVSPDTKLGRWGDTSIDTDFGTEHIQQMFSHKESGTASSGERMLREIARVALSQPKEVEYRVKSDRFYDKKLYDLAVRALKGKAHKGKLRQQVLLLDEVERSMDFVNQALWWNKVKHAHRNGSLQIVIATHSPFALCLDESEVNFIETSPGYIDKARKAMSDAGWVHKGVTDAN